MKNEKKPDEGQIDPSKNLRRPKITVRERGLYGSARDTVPENETVNDQWMQNIFKVRQLLDIVTNPKRVLEDRREPADKVLKLCSEIPISSEVRVRALMNMSIVHRELGNATMAREYNNQARQFVLDNPDMFDEKATLIWLSTIKMMDGKIEFVQHFYQDAESLFLESWALRRSYFLPLMNLFYVAFELRKLSDAEFWYKIMETYDEEFCEVSELLDLKMDFLREYETKRAAAQAASDYQKAISTEKYKTSDLTEKDQFSNGLSDQ